MDDFWNMFFLLQLEKLVRKRKRIKAELEKQNRNVQNDFFHDKLPPSVLDFENLEIEETDNFYKNENSFKRVTIKRTYKKSDLMPNPRPYIPPYRIQLTEEDLLNKVSRNYSYNVNNENNKNQMCDICGIIIRRDNMKYHINTHLKRRPFVCTYKNCNKKFASRSTMYNHRRLHTTTKNFKCDLCPATFHFNGNLKKHKATHLEPKFKCDVCNRMYKTKDRVKYHMYTHKLSDEVTCTVPSCDRRFPNQFRLQDHMRRFHKVIIRERVSRPST